MNNIINEALIPVKQELTPNIRAIMHQIMRMNTVIINMYTALLDDAAENDEDRTRLAEDRNTLVSLQHDQDIILHSLTHEADTLETIGAPRKVERYFNSVDGNLVEVDREHFAGLPEESENSQGGRVMTFGSPDK